MTAWVKQQVWRLGQRLESAGLKLQSWQRPLIDIPHIDQLDAVLKRSYQATYGAAYAEIPHFVVRLPDSDK